MAALVFIGFAILTYVLARTTVWLQDVAARRSVELDNADDEGLL
jgi:hypothetical protein